jgi:hypothetical protein
VVAWGAVALSPALLHDQGGQFLAVTAATTLLAVVGAIDDMRSLPAAARRGYCVHVMPTHSWRFWTTLSAFPTAFQYAATLKSQLLPLGIPERSNVRRSISAWLQVARHLAAPFFQRRHGARQHHFRTLVIPSKLVAACISRRRFRSHNRRAMGLFYTGHMTLGQAIDITTSGKFRTN